MQTHSQERKFKCEDCGRGFIRKGRVTDGRLLFFLVIHISPSLCDILLDSFNRHQEKGCKGSSANYDGKEDEDDEFRE